MRKLLLLLPVLLLNGCGPKKLNTNTVPKESLNNLRYVELILTPQEKAELSLDRWKNSDNEAALEQIINAGLNGDRGALYVLGSMYKTGKNGVPIDIEAANSYFIVSASLGFAPALDKVRRMYLYDTPNLYLMMIYLNLTITAGHTEFVNSYNKLKNELIHDFGESIIQEIERISRHKQYIIEKNRVELKCNKTTDFITSNAFQSITAEDLLLDNDYWYKIYVGDAPIDK